MLRKFSYMKSLWMYFLRSKPLDNTSLHWKEWPNLYWCQMGKERCKTAFRKPNTSIAPLFSGTSWTLQKLSVKICPQLLHLWTMYFLTFKHLSYSHLSAKDLVKSTSPSNLEGLECCNSSFEYILHLDMLLILLEDCIWESWETKINNATDLKKKLTSVAIFCP